MRADLCVGRSLVACLVICGAAVQMLPSRIYAQQRTGTNPDYTISLFAGGPVGFAGDGGQASTARFNDAAGLAIDRAGTMYVADEHTADAPTGSMPSEEKVECAGHAAEKDEEATTPAPASPAA